MRYRLKVGPLVLFIRINYSLPLVAAIQAEIMDSLGQSSGYTPSVADFIPEECVRMLSVVDMRGLGYDHPQTRIDSMTNRQIDLEEGHVS